MVSFYKVVLKQGNIFWLVLLFACQRCTKLNWSEKRRRAVISFSRKVKPPSKLIFFAQIIRLNTFSFLNMKKRIQFLHSKCHCLSSLLYLDHFIRFSCSTLASLIQKSVAKMYLFALFAKIPIPLYLIWKIW